MKIFLGRVAIFAVLFLSWQFASGPLIDPFFVSSPLEIGSRFIDCCQWPSVLAWLDHCG